MKITLIRKGADVNCNYIQVLAVVEARMIGEHRISPTEGEYKGIRFRVIQDEYGFPAHGRLESPIQGGASWRAFKDEDLVILAAQNRREAARKRIEAALGNAQWKITPPEALEALASVAEASIIGYRAPGPFLRQLHEVLEEAAKTIPTEL
jgi:hypothetical protein